jgi:fatty acid desaturase
MVTLTPVDIRELRDALEASGAFERRSGPAWRRFSALLLVGGLLGYVAATGPWWLTCLTLPLASLALTVAALYGHEGGHKSLSRSSAENTLMLHLAFPLLGGLGALYWCYKHNVRHHGYPNVVGATVKGSGLEASDPDLDLWPMASSSVDYEAAGPARRFFHRYCQGYCFWPLTALLVFAMRVQSLQYLFGRIRARGFDRAVALDLTALAGHYLCWIVLPGLFFGFVPAGLFYFGLWMFSGLYLAAIFVGAHFGMPVFTSPGDPWSLQLRTTRNLRLPRWAAWAMVGLDHQVEHHLFPRMAHARMPAAALVVHDWAMRKGVPHESMGFGAALVEATRFMHHAWREQPLASAAVDAGAEAAASPAVAP